MTWSGRYNLVTAIYFNSRGFAFAIFEGELAPQDWGVVEARGKQKHEKIIARVDGLLGRYRPDVLVLQNMSEASAHRPHRIRQLNEAITELAEQCGLRVVFLSRERVRQCFAYLQTVTKDTIAEAIAKHIPAFERFLPVPRKPWQSEDARMGIFDAAALALVFFQSNGQLSQSNGEPIVV